MTNFKPNVASPFALTYLMKSSRLLLSDYICGFEEKRFTGWQLVQVSVMVAYLGTDSLPVRPSLLAIAFGKLKQAG
jgi:hypothetical protein